MDTRPVLVFGDSHSLVFRGIDTVRHADVRTLGVDILQAVEATAYGLGRAESRFRWLLEKAFANRGHGAIVISLGEIDCRRHIVPKAAEHGRSIEAEAAAVARRLFYSVQDASRFGDVPFLFVSPIASCAHVKYEHWGVSGTMRERNRATMAFRDALAELSPVIDTLDITMNHDFTTRTDALFDPIHLSARHLPTLLDRLRALGVHWAETGGGDFRLAHRGFRPGITANEQSSPSGPSLYSWRRHRQAEP